MPGANSNTDIERKPPWLRAQIPGGRTYQQLQGLVKTHRLHTVCASARCPNLGECWNRGIATVMILGDVCTRSCGFCAIETGRPSAADFGEPARVADAVRIMGLRHVVITSVARDELADGGSEIWARTIRAVRRANPETSIEVLIPDFRGHWEDLHRVLDAEPDILNHNVETVPSLHKLVRPQAGYERSLEVLRRSKERGFTTKTSIMLGLGEAEDELLKVFQDLVDIKVDILTLGQYLRPSKNHLPVRRWVTPEDFARLKATALTMGFGVCESAPLVRSSYHADEQSEKYTRQTVGKAAC
ncbi:MAG: lipoyl synthase [Verrucomicrobiales bacterium]|jgi:lipoic acid synthetase|nr:lipoyl synthase [Verrucomicrobiales bacterium]